MQNTHPQEILADPSASHWLKAAILSLLKRDVGDAVNDAEMLAGAFASQRERLQAEQTTIAAARQPLLGPAFTDPFV